MAGVKRLILSAFLFFQGIDAFCIHNELTDGSSFTAAHVNSITGTGTFSQHMKRGAIECCHYTNKDCSRNQRDDDEIMFRLYLFFVDDSGDARIAKCTTGGKLIIRGTTDNYHGECIDATGLSTMFLLKKEHTYGSPPQTTESA